MSGYQTIQRIRRLEDQVDKLGFRMGNSKHGNFRQEFGDIVALFPKEDCLPVYARDAELFTGTLEELEVWIRGVEWARGYDMLLRATDDKKRVKQEDKVRHSILLRKIKDATIKTNIEA